MIKKMCDFCKKKDVCKYIDKYNNLVKEIEDAKIEEQDIFNIAITCIYYDDGMKYHFISDGPNYWLNQITPTPNFYNNDSLAKIITNEPNTTANTI